MGNLDESLLCTGILVLVRVELLAQFFVRLSNVLVRGRFVH